MGSKYGEQPLYTGGIETANYYDGYAVTPNDTLATYQAQVPNGLGQAIIATGAGNINVVLDAYGNTAVIAVAVANNIIPCSIYQVKATSTTATGISVLFRNGG